MQTEKKQRRPGISSLMGEVLRLMVKIAAIALIGLAIFAFVFGAYRNTEGAMYPMVKDGDVVLFYRLDKTYVAGDMIVFAHRGQMQVRRVVAVAGDTVEITEIGLRINGAYAQEPGIFEDTQAYVEGIDFPITVGEGQVFVLGDSREHATDSRIYGCVDIRDTYGKVMAILRRRNL